ncbi:hypothetical protein MAPG_09081 [Magnaporthiopsis poae ATCC 64411]|uniref:Uncharacterized protein n=1 Tax=Magnaporthiopsis poae (strain ATCC 64411 / 73-15) TaxID=644358 RepID=A0A0C4E905_MAGP6|nr:hypothetical protein MAPG_09081 [Magnaporthiopsis poae ATCC 64411]
MGIIPESPSTVSTRREWDTGFPESFCGNGNTTLRHPDAKVGADACITADDIPVSQALNRERRSFLSSKYSKRTISHGVLTPQQQQSIVRQQNTASVMYSDCAIIDSDAESATLTPFMPSRSTSYGMQTSGDSFEGRRSSTSVHDPKDESNMPPSSPSSTSTSRSRGFLRRLRRHRD